MEVLRTNGIFAGSFDPVTKGHLAVIETASKLVDTLYVVVADNPEKDYMFDVDERLDMINVCTVGFPNVMAFNTNNLIVNAAKTLKAGVLFRGLRYVSEYEYELDLALNNAKIGDLQTVGVFPKDLYVSSSAVRMLINYNNEKWKEYVDPNVATYIGRILELRK